MKSQRHNDLGESRCNSQERSINNSLSIQELFISEKRAINIQQVTSFGNSGLVPLK